jgi:hypothetical protein
MAGRRISNVELRIVIDQLVGSRVGWPELEGLRLTVESNLAQNPADFAKKSICAEAK